MRLCGSSKIVVGRGLSHDINLSKSVRLHGRRKNATICSSGAKALLEAWTYVGAETATPKNRDFSAACLAAEALSPVVATQTLKDILSLDGTAYKTTQKMDWKHTEPR
jgi:hypothetical protein